MKARYSERRGHEQPAERGARARQTVSAPAERGQRGHPAETPGERPQVVERARPLRARRACPGFGRQRGLVRRVRRGSAVVEQRVGVRDRNARERATPRDRASPRERAAAPPARPAVEVAARAGRREVGQRARSRPCTWSRRPARARRRRAAWSRSAPFAQHAGAAEQRQRQRRERGHVVEREVRVEDGQEGDRLDRRREQPDGAAEQPRAGQVEQPQRERPEHRGGDARERVELRRGAARRRARRRARAAVADARRGSAAGR